MAPVSSYSSVFCEKALAGMAGSAGYVNAATACPSDRRPPSDSSAFFKVATLCRATDAFTRTNQLFVSVASSGPGYLSRKTRMSLMMPNKSMASRTEAGESRSSEASFASKN